MIFYLGNDNKANDETITTTSLITRFRLSTASMFAIFLSVLGSKRSDYINFDQKKNQLLKSLDRAELL